MIIRMLEIERLFILHASERGRCDYSTNSSVSITKRMSTPSIYESKGTHAIAREL